MTPNPKLNVFPFTIKFPEEKIAALQANIKSAVIPNNIDDTDGATGLKVADFKTLMEYWQTQYRLDDELNALNELPQFHTEIEGVDIHFIHARSPHDNATPIILMHGWPSTPFEFRRIIPTLTRPARPDDAFHVVAPSLPGFIFSKTQPGIGCTKSAVIFKELMQRLGYDKYIVYGADLSNVVASMMVSKDPEKHCIGLHQQGSICIPRLSIWSPWRSIKNLFSMMFAFPSRYERLKKQIMMRNYLQETSYLLDHCTKPRTIGLALSQSPVAAAVWIADKYVTWTDSTGVELKEDMTKEERLQLFAEKLDISRTQLQHCRVRMEEILTTITLFILTESLPTSIDFYRNSLWLDPWAIYTDTEVPKVPVAISEFTCDITWSPSWWISQQYGNVVQHNFHDKGGHFPALEYPDTVVCDIVEFKHRLNSKKPVRGGDGGKSKYE